MSKHFKWSDIFIWLPYDWEDKKEITWPTAIETQSYNPKDYLPFEALGQIICCNPTRDLWKEKIGIGILYG